jgi:hypothetical protein
VETNDYFPIRFLSEFNVDDLDVLPGGCSQRAGAARADCTRFIYNATQIMTVPGRHLPA